MIAERTTNLDKQSTSQNKGNKDQKKASQVNNRSATLWRRDERTCKRYVSTTGLLEALVGGLDRPALSAVACHIHIVTVDIVTLLRFCSTLLEHKYIGGR